MKKIRVLKLLITLPILCQLTTHSVVSADYTATTAQNAGNRLLNLKILKSKSPNDPLALHDEITRAELVTIIVRAFGQEANAALLNGAAAFPDTATHWASGNIAMAKSLVEKKGGDAIGLPDGSFNPDGKLTPAQAVAFLIKFLGVRADATKAWPDSYLDVAVEQGLITAEDKAIIDGTGIGNANRGLVFYLMDRSFNRYDLGGGKTFYTTYYSEQTSTTNGENGNSNSGNTSNSGGNGSDGNNRDDHDRNDPPSSVMKRIPNQTNHEGDNVRLEIEVEKGEFKSFNIVGDLPPGVDFNESDRLFTGTISYAAANAQSPTKTYSIDVYGEDKSGSTHHRRFQWSITDVDTRPALDTLNDRSNEEGETVNWQAVGHDEDGDGLSFTATGLPAGVSIDQQNGAVTGAPSSAGQYPVTVTVSDDTPGGTNGDSDSKNFTWIISAKPAPPPAPPPPSGDMVDVRADYDLLTEEIIKGDNLDLSHVIYNLPLPTSGEHGSTISWTSDNDSAVSTTGNVTRSTSDINVVVTATLQKGSASLTKTFHIVVLASDPVPTNHAPEKTPKSTDLTGNVGERIALHLNEFFTDPDEDILTFAVSPEDTENATASVDGDDLFIDMKAPGTVTFTVTADDGHGGIVTSTITLTVTSSPTS